MASTTTPVACMRTGDHYCLPFGSEEEQGDIVGAFVRHGLRAGDKVVYISAGSPPDTVELLADRGVDARRGLARGQLEVLEAEHAYLAVRPFDPDAMVERLRRMLVAALHEGYPRLRVTGELGVLQEQPGRARLLEYERKVGQAFSDGPLLALCQYDRRMFAPEEVAAMERVHQGRAEADPLYHDTILSVTRTYVPPGLRVCGEIDMTHDRLWEESLAHAVLGMGEDVHLDLSGLRFLDVAGARLLGRTARALAEQSRRLHLDQLAEGPRRVLRLTRWDETPTLVVYRPST